MLKGLLFFYLADLVVGVPESGNVAALGYSLQSGIPYGTAFVKNHPQPRHGRGTPADG